MMVFFIGISSSGGSFSGSMLVFGRVDYFTQLSSQGVGMIQCTTIRKPTAICLHLVGFWISESNQLFPVPQSSWRQKMCPYHKPEQSTNRMKQQIIFSHFYSMVWYLSILYLQLTAFFETKVNPSSFDQVHFLGKERLRG